MAPFPGRVSKGCSERQAGAGCPRRRDRQENHKPRRGVKEDMRRSMPRSDVLYTPGQTWHVRNRHAALARPLLSALKALYTHRANCQQPAPPRQPSCRPTARLQTPALTSFRPLRRTPRTKHDCLVRGTYQRQNSDLDLVRQIAPANGSLYLGLSTLNFVHTPCILSA